MSKKLATKIEDYKAPWEVNSDGTDIPEDDQQLDPVKLKKYLFGLLGDKDRLQTSVATLTTERDEIKTKLDDEVTKHLGDDEKAAADRQKELDKAKAEGGLGALKLEVALDIEGISAAQAKTLAKSLSGSTREELSKHAEELVEAFGFVKPAGSDEEEEETEVDNTPASRPRTRRPAARGDNDSTAPSLPDPSDHAKLDQIFPRR